MRRLDGRASGGEGSEDAADAPARLSIERLVRLDGGIVNFCGGERGSSNLPFNINLMKSREYSSGTMLLNHTYLLAFLFLENIVFD